MDFKTAVSAISRVYDPLTKGLEKLQKPSLQTIAAKASAAFDAAKASAAFDTAKASAAFDTAKASAAFDTAKASAALEAAKAVAALHAVAKISPASGANYGLDPSAVISAFELVAGCIAALEAKERVTAMRDLTAAINAIADLVQIEPTVKRTKSPKAKK